ncbi:MAG: acyl carrier protein [Clostridiales bacterium]|nr:acyl carrier protein [Clostridiales bacterium]
MEQLIAILNEIVPDLDYTRCDTLVSGRYLDSFDIVTLVADIYEAFGVRVPAQYLTPENFDSAARIWALLCRLQAK